jgi:hypothetical protein
MDIATKFASGQEAVEAIFRKDKQPQGQQQEDVPEASAQRGTKKKAKKKSQAKRDAADADLVAAAEHRNPRKPPRGANLFDKMLKESCPYHQGPVKHTLEECVMLRRYFHKAGSRRKMEKAKATTRRRATRQSVPSPGRYPLVVDPVIGNARLTKVLMDGGSSLNIIYADTLGLLEIDLSMIRAGAAPFHGIVPRKRVLPLGQLDLPVCFGTPSNFHRETLMFEVVGFRGTYHTVMGRPCYAKFMAVPNYTYLKIKMPGPNRVITVGSTY